MICMVYMCISSSCHMLFNSIVNPFYLRLLTPLKKAKQKWQLYSPTKQQSSTSQGAEIAG